MRKVTSIALAGCLLLGSTSISLADSNEVDNNQLIPTPVLYNQNDGQEESQSIEKIKIDNEFEIVHYNSFNLMINGKVIDLGSYTIFTKDTGAVMLPLRLIAEELGYDVVWNQELWAVELTKGSQWIMVKVSEDYYSFGKMAPMALGTPAEIVEDRTYVPIEFITDILREEARIDTNGIVTITTDSYEEEAPSTINSKGTITDIIETAKGSMIWMKGTEAVDGIEGVIVLHVDENTEIVHPVTNEVYSIDDLEVGDTIRGYYGPAMTASIPPQASAIKIEVLRDVVMASGTITDIKINDQSKQIQIGDYMNGTILIITDDTQIVTEDNKEISLESLSKGLKIDVYHDPVMTMSLPPMTRAQKIVVKGSPTLNYDISDNILKDEASNTEIHYPQMVNYPGELLMDYMNQSLDNIVNLYGNSVIYTDVLIDYKITKMDEDILSIVYQGSAHMKDIGNINIQHSINLDIHSSNEITYDNLVNDKKAVREILDEKAKLKGLKEGLEAEGIRIYFEGDNVIFYYMPLDDQAKDLIELNIPLNELEDYLNTEFGAYPAS